MRRRPRRGVGPGIAAVRTGLAGRAAGRTVKVWAVLSSRDRSSGKEAEMDRPVELDRPCSTWKTMIAVAVKVLAVEPDPKQRRLALPAGHDRHW